MNFASREQEILKQWEQREIFKKTLQKKAPQGSFVFFEGPPTANGQPGIHHAETRVFKDCLLRFKTMQGFFVLRKAGWDTHGLPVELEAEKQLGFTGKAQIEEYGIAPFNEQCKQSVWKYKKEWEEFTRRLGFWLDMEDAYVTYHPKYIESLWWIIKQIWDKGLLYKDYRVTPHCPRCETSLSSHELSQGYKDVNDLAVTVKFKIVGEEEASFLAWTTTPWTLPGNVALAVGKDIDYVKIKQGQEFFWLAKERLDIVKGEFETVDEVKGDALMGKKYEPLFPYLREVVNGTDQSDKKEWSVLPADFVTTKEGTGIVHTAVMYGQDDFELGNQVGLPKQHLVKLDGTFINNMDFLSGRLVTDEQVAIDILKDLAHRGLLFAKEKYQHSYPHCWRCKSKIIYYAKDSWYIAMSKQRDELLKQNSQIHWEPQHIKDGRFGEWLREVKDWAFSRERYWGTPLPIWECQKCDHKMCVGSFEELFSLSAQANVGESRDFSPRPSGSIEMTQTDFDPHRPYVDQIELTCEKCGGVANRVTDVCDVWFDSGAMPFAQWHYPFENQSRIDSGENYPADYISEAIDQTRGWFYTLLAVATLLGRERPFKNVICLGHMLDAEGKKMSKSLGNIVLPMEMMDKHGADAVRWYMYTINQPGESKRFDEKVLGEMVRQNFGILANAVRFYKMFEKESEKSKNCKREKPHVLDQWILARLNKLIDQTTQRLETYIITETVRELGEFITDLSTWYVRRSRERFKGTDEQDKQTAISTLGECLLTLSKLMAPFVPFLADSVYQDVGGEKESVHLEDWPVADASHLNDHLLTNMEQTRRIVSSALERRSQAGINVRQALASAIVTIPSGELTQEYIDVIQDEINVKSLVLKPGDLAVELDLVLTTALIREGAVREIIRRINALRKQAGLTIQDRIELFVSGSDAILQAVFEHQNSLLHSTLSDVILTEGNLPEQNETFNLNGEQVIIGLKKVL